MPDKWYDTSARSSCTGVSLRWVAGAVDDTLIHVLSGAIEVTALKYGHRAAACGGGGEGGEGGGEGGEGGGAAVAVAQDAAHEGRREGRLKRHDTTGTTGQGESGGSVRDDG